MRIDSTKITDLRNVLGKKLNVQDVQQYEILCSSGKSIPISCLEYEMILSDVRIDIYL